MSFCTQCGTKLEEGVKFCPNCGQPVTPKQTQPVQPIPSVQTDSNSGSYDTRSNPQDSNWQGYANQNGYTRQTQPQISPSTPVNLVQHSIAMCIVLSIITCGIYSIFWVIQIVNDLNEASRKPQATSGATVFLLGLVTCGICMLYWLYKSGEAVNEAKAMRGMQADSNNGMIYLILGIFGFSIVSYSLLQNELNQIAAYHGAPNP